MALYKTFLSVTATIILSGCSVEFTKTSVWTYSRTLDWSGIKYTVTKQSSDNVGKKLGQVSYQKDRTTYDLFSIPNMPISNEIAIRTSQGYFIAQGYQPFATPIAEKPIWLKTLKPIDIKSISIGHPVYAGGNELKTVKNDAITRSIVDILLNIHLKSRKSVGLCPHFQRVTGII